MGSKTKTKGLYATFWAINNDMIKYIPAVGPLTQKHLINFWEEGAIISDIRKNFYTYLNQNKFRHLALPFKSRVKT